MPKRKILCVSFDRTVSENWCATLKEVGYDVTETTNVKEAVELLSRESFDAVIVGHRFPVKERYVLAVEAREKSNTPVLLVCGARPDSEIPATSRVYALEGSAGLLSALAALFPAAAEARLQAAA
jgi:DNA-binding response OmpR family regulator